MDPTLGGIKTNLWAMDPTLGATRRNLGALDNPILRITKSRYQIKTCNPQFDGAKVLLRLDYKPYKGPSLLSVPYINAYLYR